MTLFLAKGKELRKTSLYYTVNQLMIDGGLERRQTIMTSLSRLEDAGWLDRKAEPEGRKGVLRTITMPRELRREAVASVFGYGAASTVGQSAIPINHDAFANSGLGKTGYFIVRALCDDSRAGTPEALDTKGTFERQAIVRSTGLSAATVTRHLTKLAELNAVEKVGGGWRVSRNLDLDGIAKTLGTSGTGKRIAERVKLAREEQAERLRERPRRGR
jgi:DNA-binding transcriptional ArsR family regulator